MIEVPIATQLRPAKTPIAILGVPFDSVTTANAVALIEQMIASRQSHYVATANVDFVVQAQSDVELRHILFDAHLVLCDGTPLVWASRWLRNPLPERVAGSDLVPKLIEVAAEKGYRIFLLGATPEAAGKAVENLRHRYPHLLIAGQYSPPFTGLLEMDHNEISRRIREAKPDLLFVSFGCPKQEKWVAMHYRSLAVPVSIGVGATIDFLAGYMKRAPVWMQRTGTEWIFRLAQEPRRLFKRYASDLVVFGWRILGQLRQGQFQKQKSNLPHNTIITRQEKQWQQVTLPHDLNAASVRLNSTLLESILRQNKHCWLEMSKVRRLDSTGVGWLIHLHKHLATKGRHVILLSPSKAVRRMLAFMRLQDFFLTAPDFSTAQRMGEHLLHEQAAPVAMRTAVAANPLMWQGEITALNAARVWIATERYLSSLRKPELMIDLSRVRFMDSSGAAVMARAGALAEQLQIELVFTRARAAVQNVLRHAHLDRLLSPPPARTLVAAEVPGQLVLSRQT